jgi:glycogen operon protein
VRDFWRGTEGVLGDFATRVTGSSDLYGRGRRPTASINLVTVHDGFTLADLVSYDHKHNEANGEDNRDGTDDNRSWNCGVEGATDDPEVLALRARQRRNLLATLLLSEGVPLLLGGDELGRTQGGNNNAYCQDNAVSWVDWSLAGGTGDVTEFVASLVKLRMSHPGLHRGRFFSEGDIEWLRPDGGRMTDADWAESFARAVAVTSATGPLTLLFNAWWEPLTFRLPERLQASAMSTLVDTSGNATAVQGGVATVGPRSLLVVSR